jgi:hypothetical protein
MWKTYCSPHCSPQLYHDPCEQQHPEPASCTINEWALTCLHAVPSSQKPPSHSVHAVTSPEVQLVAKVVQLAG